MSMRIVSFADCGVFAPGILTDDETIVPLIPALDKYGIRITSTREILGLWHQLEGLVCEDADAGRVQTLAASAVRLGPPIPDAGQVIAVGFNYDTHTEIHSGSPSNADPVVFMKSPTSISGPYDPVIRPAPSQALDYEAEIAIVIGRPGYRIERTQATSHIAGYMLANDITARDIALPHGFDSSPLQAQIVRGKGYPTFCPTGPWLMTVDRTEPTSPFDFELYVNDELRQSGSSKHMVLGFAEIVETVSATIALNTGDIILTGTPGGCGFQFDPPRYLQPGDVITARSERLGTMRLPIHDDFPAGSWGRV